MKDVLLDSKMKDAVIEASLQSDVIKISPHGFVLAKFNPKKGETGFKAISTNLYSDDSFSIANGVVTITLARDPGHPVVYNCGDIDWVKVYHLGECVDPVAIGS